MQLEGGIGFILERPMTMGLLAFAVLLVVLPTYRARIRAQGIADGD
jgi:putative tricarboxylic transport membrane protein